MPSTWNILMVLPDVRQNSLGLNPKYDSNFISQAVAMCLYVLYKIYVPKLFKDSIVLDRFVFSFVL